MSETLDTFWMLCAEVDNAFQGVDDVLPSLEKALSFVESIPRAEEQLAPCFVEVLKGRGPWEVVYYCMKKLQWPIVYQAATNLLENTDDFRVKDVMMFIRKAYDPESGDDEYLY